MAHEVEPPTEPGVAVPNYADVLHARADEHKAARALEREKPSRDEVKQIAVSVVRRWGLITVALSAVIALLVSIAALAQALSTDSDLTAALEKLDQANSTLEARGQQPVPEPAMANPTDAITAAVTAQVLASLPPSPTADEVASRIQGAVIANVTVPGPTTAQLAASVSEYLQANPPSPGPAPSQAEIDAAVGRALAANPPPAGPAGRDGISGANGRDGVDGKNGEDGADSTVPGPQGETGPPGPTCPEGSTATEHEVVTTEGPVTALLCTPT